MCSKPDHIIIEIPRTSGSDESANGSILKIDNLEYFPEKVLMQIFTNSNDTDLLNLSDISCRFDGIAKFVFKRKYKNMNFVFDGDSRSKRKLYSELFTRFGSYAEIRAIEVKNFRNIDEHHWLSKLLHQHTKKIEKLTFDGCSFRRINRILSQHIYIKHLILRSVSWESDLWLPKYRHLKKLEVSNPIGTIRRQRIIETLQNNPSMESLVLIYCRDLISISSVAKYLWKLKELQLISDRTWTYSNMDLITDSLKHLDTLKITIGSQDIELVRKLAVECKNLKQLELDYFIDHRQDSSDEIIMAATQFRTIESLELSHLKTYDSMKTLAEHLPNLSHLRHLKLFMNTPQYSNTFIPSLSQKSPTLKMITIAAWNERSFFEWPEFFLNAAIFKEIFETFRKPLQIHRPELKQYQPDLGFATNKEITWCNEKSHWIVNDSYLFSHRILLKYFGFIVFILYFLIIRFLDLYFHSHFHRGY